MCYYHYIKVLYLCIPAVYRFVLVLVLGFGMIIVLPVLHYKPEPYFLTGGSLLRRNTDHRSSLSEVAVC